MIKKTRMTKNKFIIALVFILSLLLLCSCNSNEDPNKDQNEPLKYPFAAPESKPITSYNEADVYRHAFEEHSRELSKEELDSIKVDCTAGEAIVAFKTYNDLTELTVKSEVYYLVKGFSSATTNNSSKYSISLNTLFNAMPFVSGTVTNDYHEAYLDVLIENLSFSDYDGNPNMATDIYQIGSVSDDAAFYNIYSDGHIYKCTKSDRQTYFRSNEKVDLAYLYGIIYFAHLNECNLEKEQRIYINESFSTSGTTSTVIAGETYLVNENGTCFKIEEPKWHMEILDASYNSAEIYAQMTRTYLEVPNQ